MRIALRSFNREIARIDAVSDWLITPPALASSMLPATIAIRCGSVVLLSGYFEAFIRDCMQNFIGYVNALHKPVLTLPDKMRFTHFENGAKALSAETRKARKSNDTSLCEDLAVRLASFKIPTNYTLVWEAFAQTKANPGPDVIKELLNCVGVTDPWRKLIGSMPPGLVDIELFLTSFVEMRNECAHSGTTTSPPTPPDLKQYGVYLSALAHGIVKLLEERIGEIAELL